VLGEIEAQITSDMCQYGIARGVFGGHNTQFVASLIGTVSLEFAVIHSVTVQGFPEVLG